MANSASNVEIDGDGSKKGMLPRYFNGFVTK